MRDRIALVLDRLSPAERKVAELVAADPAAIMAATTASLARAAGVSEPTVVRFCRSLGYEGFADLRLALNRAEAAAEAAPPPRPPARIDAATPVPQAAPAVLDAAMAALAQARAGLDAAAVERAALALLRAARVEVWAVGASAGVAADLAQRLVVTCRGVVARHDPHAQAMATALLDGESVALCLSLGGRSRAVVEAARQAALAGATVIALTRPGSPLAAAAAITVPCLAEEAAAPHAPWTGRLVQFAIGDAICVATALLSPPAAAAARQARMTAALEARRIDP
ncbi:MurR/RpiR family transcriptional regulator [Falsiroseomonas ponticola]|uniref:MurR/RpiR family transcriptional regulator n=1 Tax=Falsiroseomonas ponticola TaxID=2786951 RepID=UPI001932CA3D|nr:MurR/RpiR family transcriptional regulator [Roseomonas ponticola]